MGAPPRKVESLVGACLTRQRRTRPCRLGSARTQFVLNLSRPRQRVTTAPAGGGGIGVPGHRASMKDKLDAIYVRRTEVDHRAQWSI